MRLTDEDILGLFDSSDDELDLEQSDEDLDFEPDLIENLSESSSSHELSFSDDIDMVADSVGASTDVDDMDVDIGNASGDAETIVNVSDSTPSNNDWSPYTPTDSNLLKLPFTANNPRIRLPTSGQYENELSYFQLYFTDDIITKFVHETNKYAKEKIEKAQPLSKRSIWRTWKDTTLEEMKGFLGVVINMGMNPKCSIKEYFSSQWTERMPFFVDVFSRERFCQIYWMLHLQQSVGQGFCGDKIQNLVDHMNLTCRKYFVPNENIAVDETTVGFKGQVI